MSSQQLRCDSDSDGINFDGKSVEESGPSTSTSASTSLYRPPSKRQKVSRRLPVDFDSTTEEEQEDEVDFQVNLTLTYLIFTRTHSLQNLASLYNIFVLEIWCFPAPWFSLFEESRVNQMFLLKVYVRIIFMHCNKYNHQFSCKN